MAKGGAMSFEAAKAHLEQYGLADRVEELVGHALGGVCPFAVRIGVPVYLDESLRRFEYVYPACGSSNSAVRLTPAELERASGCVEWVDVCKLPEMGQ